MLNPSRPAPGGVRQLGLQASVVGKKQYLFRFQGLLNVVAWSAGQSAICGQNRT
jgi:hypothetical protein